MIHKTCNDILFGVMSGFIFLPDQSVMILLNLQVLNQSTLQELLSDWSVYLIILHMIGRSKINERSHHMTPYGRGPGDSMRQVVGSNNSYKPITNTAWVCSQLCELQKGCTRLAAASDKVYQLLAHGRRFYPASSTTKTGRHDIAEILLKVALNTKIQFQIQILHMGCCTMLVYHQKKFICLKIRLELWVITAKYKGFITECQDTKATRKNHKLVQSN